MCYRDSRPHIIQPQYQLHKLFTLGLVFQKMGIKHLGIKARGKTVSKKDFNLMKQIFIGYDKAKRQHKIVIPYTQHLQHEP